MRYVPYVRITKTRLIYGRTDQERTGGEKPTDSTGHCECFLRVTRRAPAKRSGILHEIGNPPEKVDCLPACSCERRVRNCRWTVKVLGKCEAPLFRVRGISYRPVRAQFKSHRSPDDRFRPLRNRDYRSPDVFIVRYLPIYVQTDAEK